MLINFSNHPSDKWSNEQSEAARVYGAIYDYPFPPVDAIWNTQHVEAKALQIVQELIAQQPDAVLCQGEFTLTYQVVSLLKQHGIPVIAACSERRVVNRTDPDGNTIKNSVFTFVRFREY